jgi:hypothetical protein
LSSDLSSQGAASAAAPWLFLVAISGLGERCSLGCGIK